MLGKLAAVLLVMALAGCSEAAPREEVTVTFVQGEVPADGYPKVKLANCGEDALLSYQIGNPGKGRVGVTVEEGRSIPIFNEQMTLGSSGEEELAGTAGKWHLSVFKDEHFDGAFTITLTC